MLISRFSKLLDNLDAIDSVENMECELKKGELLRRDVVNLVGSLTPYIPSLRLLSGGITVGKHVSNHMMNKTEKQPDNKTAGDDETVAKEE